jgi:hypothetical protein
MTHWEAKHRIIALMLFAGIHWLTEALLVLGLNTKSSITLHVVYCLALNTNADLLSKQRVEWILGRYTNGIREYASLPDTVLGELVILGFLIPVMIGYFLPQSAANHESPIEQWVADAREAGFTNVSKHKLFEYVIGAEWRI